MKRILTLTAIMIFVIGTSAMILAQPPEAPMPPAAPAPMMGHGMCGGGPGDGPMGGCNFLDCAKELNLTADQISKLKDLNFAHRNLMIDLNAQMEKAQLKMKHEMNMDNPDKGKVLTASAEITAMQGKLAEARINHQFAMRQLLTKEQLEKWQACQRECGGKCGGGMGMMGCGKGGGMDHKCDPAKCDPAKCKGEQKQQREGACMKGK